MSLEIGTNLADTLRYIALAAAVAYVLVHVLTLFLMRGIGR